MEYNCDEGALARNLRMKAGKAVILIFGNSCSRRWIIPFFWITLAGCHTEVPPQYEPSDYCIVPGVEASESYILVRADGNDEITVGGEPVRLENVTTAVIALLKKYPEAGVMIVAEPKTKSGTVIDILDQINAVEEIKLVSISASTKPSECESDRTEESEN